MLTESEILDRLNEAACDAWNAHNRIMEALERGDTKGALQISAGLLLPKRHIIHCMRS